MNARLVHPGRPVHPDPPRRRVELGVHADDDVALLEPEPEQRLQPVRPDARGPRPASEQRPPELDRPVDRVVQLPGGLARERQAHDVARARPRPRRGRGARQRGGSASPSRRSSSPASGPVTLIAASDIVRSMTWTRRPHVSIQSRSHISALAAPPDVKRQHEPGLGLAQDHPVVHDVAALVEQQRVARAAGLDVRDVARVDPLQRLDDVRPADDELAERAHVADRDALADGPVLARPRRRSATAATSRRSGPSGRRARGARRGAASAGRRRPSTSAAASAERDLAGARVGR